MSPAKKLKEKTLLYRIKSKQDPQAFGELYDDYIEKIYRFIYFKVPNKEEAEDVTSDVFLKAWNYLTDAKKDQVKSFSGLIYTIARSSLIDFYRKKSRRQESSIENVPDKELMSEETQFEEVATAFEMNEVLAAIRKMKQSYQDVITLRYLDELSVKEIAQILDKSSGSVRVLLHRALKLLQSIVEEQKNNNHE